MRDTYAEIHLGNIEYNVRSIIQKYNQYQYYFGVVKADSYGHGALETAGAIINGGVNYLVVALLEEALELREKYKEIPILCLGVIQNNDIPLAIQNHITISITSLAYLQSLNLNQLEGAKVHIKVNTGMNRLGVSSATEFEEVYHLLLEHCVIVEGVYTHIHSSCHTAKTLAQFQKFGDITKNINLEEIEIVHIQASDALTDYPKPPYVNGCRLGIIIYGFTNDVSLHLKSTFRLYSKVIQINSIKKGDTVGYHATYQAKQDEKIAVVAIGYADGILRKYQNGVVYIHEKPYKIVGNICMDMLFVQVDDTVNVLDKVEVIRDNEHIRLIAKQLDTIVYEVLCNISKRVPRHYMID